MSWRSRAKTARAVRQTDRQTDRRRHSRAGFSVARPTRLTERTSQVFQIVNEWLTGACEPLNSGRARDVGQVKGGAGAGAVRRGEGRNKSITFPASEHTTALCSLRKLVNGKECGPLDSLSLPLDSILPVLVCDFIRQLLHIAAALCSVSSETH